MLKEWPLVAFTILGQTAVGLFVIGITPLVFAADVPSADARPFLALLGVVFFLLAAAALLSFLHLHHPLRAVRALANVRSSWLSREILFELLFMGLVAVEFVLVSAGWTPGPLKVAHVLAGLAGLLYLLSMIRIYMLETLPFWNQAGTPLLFVLTSLSLGALSAALILGRDTATILLVLTDLAVGIVLVDLVAAFFLAPGCGLLIRRDGPTIRPPAAPSRILHAAGLGLEAAGLISVAAVSLTPLGHRLNGIVVLALFSLIVLSVQVIRRFAFYGLWGQTKLSNR
jgi:anaerobic dimethyl sulfoxide reductase subunit C (anchor subunit)